MKLISPDLKRCQTEWLDGSFMTLGPRQYVRCEAAPSWIARERKKPHGEMSLCREHRVVLEVQAQRTVTFRPIHARPASSEGKL